VAVVAGHDVVGAPLELRRRIGLVFQATTLDGVTSAEANLRFVARLYGFDRGEATRRAHAALDLFGLAERRRDPVRELSGGMRRALDIVRGVMHEPEVVLLDEPTSGLDPAQRRRVWTLLRGLRAERGTTLLLATHRLDETGPCTAWPSCIRGASSRAASRGRSRQPRAKRLSGPEDG